MILHANVKISLLAQRKTKLNDIREKKNEIWFVVACISIRIEKLIINAYNYYCNCKREGGNKNENIILFFNKNKRKFFKISVAYNKCEFFFNSIQFWHI